MTNWIEQVEQALTKRKCTSMGMKRDGPSLTVTFHVGSLKDFPQTIHKCEDNFIKSVDAMVRHIQQMEINK